MQTVQPIEGITPGALWTFAGVLVALLGIAILVFKVIEFWQGQKDRKEKRENDDQKQIRLAEEVSRKVAADLEPRFRGIENEVSEVNRKLENDKQRLDGHERTLNSISQAQADNSEGFAVLAGALLAVLDHELHNGNEDQMNDARNELNRYLTHRRIGG